MGNAAIITCRYCGEKVERKRPTQFACPTCMRFKGNAVNGVNYLVKTGKIAKGDAAAEVERRLHAHGDERRAVLDGSFATDGKRRCPYCGTTHQLESDGYCYSCHESGLNMLHRFTHKSNGWDAAAHRVEIPPADKEENGWRGGKPMMGGCSQKTRAWRLVMADWSN